MGPPARTTRARAGEAVQDAQKKIQRSLKRNRIKLNETKPIKRYTYAREMPNKTPLPTATQIHRLIYSIDLTGHAKPFDIHRIPPSLPCQNLFMNQNTKKPMSSPSNVDDAANQPHQSRSHRRKILQKLRSNRSHRHAFDDCPRRSATLGRPARRPQCPATRPPTAAPPSSPPSPRTNTAPDPPSPPHTSPPPRSSSSRRPPSRPRAGELPATQESRRVGRRRLGFPNGLSGRALVAVVVSSAGGGSGSLGLGLLRGLAAVAGLAGGRAVLAGAPDHHLPDGGGEGRGPTPQRGSRQRRQVGQVPSYRCFVC